MVSAAGWVIKISSFFALCEWMGSPTRGKTKAMEKEMLEGTEISRGDDAGGITGSVSVSLKELISLEETMQMASCELNP